MPKKAWITLWLIIFALAIAWRAQNLDAFGLSNDEGVYLMWSRLVVDGYPLYSQTHAVQPPLFLESLALVFKVAGDTIQVGRWAMMTGFALLAVSLSWLAYKSGRWPAAITALILTGIAPLIFAYSRLAMAEIPAIGLAVAAIALLVLFTEKDKRVWLIASGLVLGLSFSFKPLQPFVIVPMGLLLVIHYTPVQKESPPLKSMLTCLVSPKKQWWPMLINGLVWATCAILPIAAVFIVYEPAAVYDQLVAFRADLRAAIPGSWSETQQQFQLFINTHRGFWLLAFGGIISTIWLGNKLSGLSELNGLSGLSNRHSFNPLNSPDSLNSFYLVFIWLVWLIAGILMLLWHTPLFAHHFVVLLPPLILLGAAFVANLITLWPVTRQTGGKIGYALLGLILVAALLSTPEMIQANQETAAIVTGGREQEALKLLEAVSTPTDFVMGDSQLLIFMANRRTPPPLGDLALVGIKAGRQTSERMIELNKQYQSSAVVQWSLRLPWLPEYLAWVNQNYLAQRVWDNDHVIHFAPRLAPDSVPNVRQDQLGDSVRLQGYQLEQTDEVLYLKLYWQTDAPLTQDYTVFAQLLDSNGTLAASHDSQPLGGYFPTSQWPANEIITDIVWLPLPANLAPGTYTLITGMYQLDTLERLPTENGDFIPLTIIDLN